MREDKILDVYFRSVGAAQSSDLAKLFKWNPREIEQAISSLIEMNILIMVDQRRWTSW